MPRSVRPRRVECAATCVVTLRVWRPILAVCMALGATKGDENPQSTKPALVRSRSPTRRWKNGTLASMAPASCRFRDGRSAGRFSTVQAPNLRRPGGLESPPAGKIACHTKSTQMNISSSCVAASGDLRGCTRVETAAEMPAAKPLASRTGRSTARFTAPPTCPT